MWGNNDVGSHAFVCDEKLDQKITWNSREQNLWPEKCGAIKMLGCILLLMVQNQTQGTLKHKGEKLVTSKNVGDNNVWSFVNLKRNSNMNWKNTWETT